jgi:hypothetical protein
MLLKLMEFLCYVSSFLGAFVDLFAWYAQLANENNEDARDPPKDLGDILEDW